MRSADQESSDAPAKRSVVLYILLLAGHALHVAEATWGHFRVLNMVGGTGPFLAINAVLFAIPVIFFVFWRRGRRWAYWLSLVYAGFMALQGVAHNVAWLATGRYFGGFAGAISGLWLIATGIPLFFWLLKSRTARVS